MDIIRSSILKIARFLIKLCQPVNYVKVGISQINSGSILLGKNIVITGGSKGIGYAMAKKFALEGANVIITGRNEESLKKSKKEIGRKCNYIVFDVNNIKELPALLDKCKIYFHGPITDLVCNAGISYHESNIMSVNEKGFDDQFNTNFKSVYFLCQTFLKYKYDEKTIESNILIISSETGDMGYDIPYGLTKASLVSLTRALSRRFYSEGIRVNSIAPGVTISEMTKYAKSDDGNLSRKCAAGRVFLPEEIAEVACFLLSDASKCISGEVIHTNAGNHLRVFWE